MISKKMLIPIAAVAIVGAGFYGASRVSAASDTTAHTSLVDQIANTFGLDKAKVQAVFDQHKAAGQANHETKYEDRLTQAVTDGKITGDQKTAIIAEHNKLAGELAALKGDTGADRRAAMQNIRTEAGTWATANNIDAKWLMIAGPMHLRGGRGMMNGDTPPAS